MDEKRKEAAGQALESTPAAEGGARMGAEADCNTPVYLRVSEAARLMKMSPRGVYYEIASGRLHKTLKRGTTSPIYVSLSEIERWRREEFVEVAG